MLNRTPRRGDRDRDQADMLTPGLIISKLGLQVIAAGDVAKGLLCLKVTLPRDVEARQARWGLFSGNPPKLTSIPTIYPLPVPETLMSSSPGNLGIATTLLSLPPAPPSYPPAPQPSSSVPKPYMEVPFPGGQVYVCVDSPINSPGRRLSLGASPGGPGVASRNEWLVVVEMEVPIEAVAGASGADELFKASIPLPRCLDNVLRFQAVPSDQQSSGEATVVTEPRVLPLPPTMFARRKPIRRPVLPTRSPRKLEDGWEDGEVPGVEEDYRLDESTDETDDEEVGDWLTGRFQSTVALSLEWGFIPSLGSLPDLRVTPHWGSRPSITVAFEATLPLTPGPLALKAVLPDEWGWSELEIRADGLLSWRSPDGEGLGAMISESAGVSADDSLSTVMGSPRKGLAGLPGNMLAGDYSFELSEVDSPTRTPATPSLRRSLTTERATAAMHKAVPRHAVVATEFELEFERLDRGVGEDDERVLLISGTLVPMPHLLVVAHSAVQIPFLRFLDSSLSSQSTIVCPSATFSLSSMSNPDGSSSSETDVRLCDVSCPSVGSFTWTDQAGEPPSPVVLSPLVGPVHVVGQRNVWGAQTMSIALSWPAKASQISMSIPTRNVRILRASSGSVELRRVVLSRAEGSEIRLSGGRGGVDLVIEVADESCGVALPSFSGKGQLCVELTGPGWDKLKGAKVKTNLTRVGELSFQGDLSLVPSITFPPVTAAGKSENKSRWPRLVSWSVLLNLLMLWILVSLAQQVQRLRSEVAFIADETRDLRMYSIGQGSSPGHHDGAPGHDPWYHDEQTPQEQHPQDSQHLYSEQYLDQESPQEQSRHTNSGSEGNVAESAPSRETGDSATKPTHRPPPNSAKTPQAHSAKGIEPYSPHYGVGRVVLGRQGWQTWLAEMPAMRQISTAAVWMWHAVRWLLFA